VNAAIAEAVRAAQIELPRRPRLAPWLTIVDLGDGRVDLRAANFVYGLRQSLLADTFRRVAPLLDGGHNVEEIARGGGEDVLPTTVVFLLKILAAHGCLQEAEPAAAPATAERSRWEGQLRLLSRLVPDAARVQAVLACARVRLVGDDPLAAVLAEELRSCGVGDVSRAQAATPDGASGETGERAQPRVDLAIVCLESPGFATLDAVNAASMRSGVRWLRVVLCGPVAHLGPTVVPHQSACYACFDLRWRSHEDELDRFLAYRAQPATADEGALAPYRSLVAAQAAIEALRLLSGFSPPTTIGRFYELDLRSPLATPHDVLKLPRCPACGRHAPAREAWSRAPSRMQP
jgi:bacteriocin biosynthesis cyclodehydratase domain-containing protein